LAYRVGERNTKQLWPLGGGLLAESVLAEASGAGVGDGGGSAEATLGAVAPPPAGSTGGGASAFAVAAVFAPVGTSVFAALSSTGTVATASSRST
jgi:hypothetical protein